MWILYAFLSSIFAALTSILAKLGIKKTDSDLATCIRTFFALFFSFIIVISSGVFYQIFEISTKSLLFLILSGIATGASWLFYFRALSMGDINKVVPIDKSSSAISIILAMILFSETNNFEVKIIAIILILSGTIMMVEFKNANSVKDKSYLIYAIFSAIFAALTSILAKIGIDNVDSNLGTFTRTIVVLLMSFLLIKVKGKNQSIKDIERKELIFIILSGFATGASWLFYYYAIKIGFVSVVVSIDKLSIVFTMVFSYLVFNEKLSKKAILGLIMIIVASFIMIVFK